MSKIYILTFKKYLTDPKYATSIRIGVGLLIYNSEKLLLEKRKDCRKWGLIGGGVNIGENVEDTAIRECIEETSIKLKKENLKFFGVYSDIAQHRIIKYEDNCFHAIDIIYSYQLVGSNFSIKKSNESIEISFFSIRSLPKNLVPPAKDPINDFIKSRFDL